MPNEKLMITAPINSFGLFSSSVLALSQDLYKSTPPDPIIKNYQGNNDDDDYDNDDEDDDDINYAGSSGNKQSWQFS